MVGWSKDEADICLFETSLQPVWIEIYPDTEILQHVRRADTSADSAVAMFGDPYTGGGCDKRRAGRDVECAGSVATGAGGIQYQPASKFQRACALAHRACA